MPRSPSLVLLLLVSMTACCADQAPQDRPPVCLLTGFEPFGEAKTNASWEMLKPLAGQTIAGYRIVTEQLPVVYDEMAKPLQDAIEKHTPALVVCFGVGTPLVRVETVARNGYHPAQPPDNKGRAPPREKILPDGAATLPTQLPAAEIVAALKAAAIGATDGQDAGGYLCNECFYRLMALPERTSAGIKRRGFVHVPPVGAPDPEGGVFTLEKLQQAVRIIVEQTAQAAEARK